VTTREKILQTALQLFNTHGYQEVGVREVARVLGISPGNLSYHFSKKEDILYNLLIRIKQNNDQHYADYARLKPTLAGFLLTLRKIFHVQYQYRGVFAGNHSIKQVLQSSDLFDYDKNARLRKTTFKKIFSDLSSANQLKTEPDDIDFLVSFVTLFGRFWVMEAFLTNEIIKQEEIINHYLKMFSHQLSLFATRDGKKSIESFLDQINSAL
jgi:AcrR family transcriptional regulator